VAVCVIVAPAPVVVAAGRPPAQASPAQTATDTEAEAYYEFLRGRTLEGNGEIEEAIQAYQRAIQLDPKSSEIRAELAGLYARENRAKEAVAAAEDALRIDGANTEANRILGTIYAAFADSMAERGLVTPEARDYATKAVEHLRKAGDGRSGGATELTLARQYITLGDYGSALEVLERVQVDDPGSREAVLLMAQAHTGAGRIDEALATLEDAIESDPFFYRARIALAELFEHQRRWPEAAETYSHAVEMNPGDARLRLREATAWINAGQMGRARDLLRTYVSARPEDAAALYLLSQAERETGDLDAAEAAARRLVGLEPQGFRGAYALAQVFEQRRDARKVVETLSPIVNASGANAPTADVKRVVLARLGFAYLDLEQYDKAIAHFQQLRSLAPDDPSSDAYLAQAYLSARRTSEAIETAQAGRKRHPDDLRLARLEAQAWQASGRKDRAVAVMEKALPSHTDDPAAHVAMAATYADASRYAEAIGVLDTAHQKFPDDLSIVFQKGAVFEQQKRYADAERAFKEVIERDPRHAAALNYLGYMLADLGQRLDESVGYIQRALAEDPHNGSYLDSLGWAYYRQNRLDLAREPLTKASEQLPGNSVVHDHLGDLLFKLELYPEAIAAWQRSLAGDKASIDRDSIERKIRQARERAERTRRP
jgi:tetratricopeptide (TPR) repeat protein